MKKGDRTIRTPRCRGLAYRLAALLMTVALGLAICAPLVHAGDLPPIPLTTKQARVAGDANGDNKVDLRDTVAVARYLAGGWNVSINEDNADVNGDKKVDLKDVVVLRRYIAGGWNISLR